MSEDHVRLFASTIPGNRSSSTLGLNAAGQSNRRQANPVGETGYEWGSESVPPWDTADDQCDRASSASEVRDGGDNQPDQLRNQFSRANDEVPEINKMDESNQGEKQDLEDESIKYMDEVIDSFRHEEISKLKALSNTISILDFNLSRIEWAKDAAVEYYTKTRDEVEALASSAIRQWRHTEIGLQPNWDWLAKIEKCWLR